MQYIIDRLKEPATYAGILAIIGSLTALKFAPDQAAAISTGLATLVGVILAATKAHGSD